MDKITLIVHNYVNNSWYVEVELKSKLFFLLSTSRISQSVDKDALSFLNNSGCNIGLANK